MARPDSWFRFYNTTVDNAKAQRLDGDTFKSWVNLLCLASQCGGKLPCVQDIAFKLRKSETEIETLLVTFQERSLFVWDGENWTPHDWNDLQFKSDSSTERVKRYRERSKKQDETKDRNVSVTAQEKNRTDHSRTDTPKPPKGIYPDDFEKWYSGTGIENYQGYPHKVGKDDALKAWKQLKKDKHLPSVDVLIEATKRYSKTKPSDISWKNPGPWLRAGRWQDEPAGSASTEPDKPPEPPPNCNGWRMAAWKSLGPAKYKSWVAIAEFTRTGEKQEIAELRYPTKFARDYVNTHLARDLERIITKHEKGIEGVRVFDVSDIPDFLNQSTSPQH